MPRSLREENLFGGLESPTSTGCWVTQNFESVKENALLWLDFGCAAHEDLWHIDGDKVRLRKLAPRLPYTFYRYHVDEDGESLLYLEQYGYRGNDFVNVLVPAEKIAYFVNDMEGAYFYGRSVLRAAYQHWYIKSQIYRIDAISIERNGLGVPTIKQGPNVSAEDRKSAAELGEDARRAREHRPFAAQRLGIPADRDLRPGARPAGLHPAPQRNDHALRAGQLPDPGDHADRLARPGRLDARFLLSLARSALAQDRRNHLQHLHQAAGELQLRAGFLRARFRIRDSGFRESRRVESREVQNRKSTMGNRQLPYPRLVTSNIVVINPLELLEVAKDVGKFDVDLLATGQ